MKDKMKKGFTIVELVIVIAVIGILAAVLVPTITSVVNKAKDSTYLQQAKNTLTTIITENGGSIDDGTYIFITEDDTNVAWYQYSEGSLNVLDEEPDMNNINLAFPITSECANYLDDGVKVYIPNSLISVVDKLNALLDGTSKDNYESIATAGNNLNDVEMACINWGRKTINSDNQQYKYSFAYDRDNNKVYVLNGDDSAVVYPTTYASVPTKYRYLTGANINNENDLLEFSKITNKWTPTAETNGHSRPNEFNFYMAQSPSGFEHSPLVIMNLKNDINMSLIENLTDWEPIANWYDFGSLYNSTSDNYGNCYDISLLVNGNNKSINNLSIDVLFGALKSDSIIRDVCISYNMGSSDNYYAITSANQTIKAKLNSINGHDLTSNLDGNIWNKSILIRSIRNGQCSTFDYNVITLIENVDLGGNCFVSIATGDTAEDRVGIVACICNEKGSVWETNTGYNKQKPEVHFNNCSLFSESDDNYSVLYSDKTDSILFYCNESGDERIISIDNGADETNPYVTIL